MRHQRESVLRSAPHRTAARVLVLMPLLWVGSFCLADGAAPTTAPTASPTVLPAEAPAVGPLNDSRSQYIPSATQPAAQGDDLRQLIGVNPLGLRRVDVPHMPVMALRGFVQPRGGGAMAILELTESKREFLVKIGTEIPVMVQGHVQPAGRTEIQGLDGQDPNNTENQPSKAPDPNEQSQVILKVVGVTPEGVTVEAGLLAERVVIR